MHPTAAPAGRYVYRNANPPRPKPQRGDMCVLKKIVQSLVIIVKPIITWTLTMGEVRNLASEGASVVFLRVFTCFRVLL